MAEKLVRNVLFRLLGLKAYLQLVSNLYIRLINAGFLKNKYPEIFYLQHLIKPGFICVDIGANVGYYAVQLSKLVGKNGHVYSVEPVPIFADVFLTNSRLFALNNITLHKVALGNQEKEVVLQTPLMNGVFRHGLTKIINDNESTDSLNTYKARQVIADKLFEPITRIDYLKCDVEGYETVLFPQMMQTIKRCKPLIQIEINTPENIFNLFNLLEPLEYKWHVLQNKNLIPVNKAEALKISNGDFYLIT